MAKNFPYFKFICADWLTGDIVFESLSTQGLFVNICALYWQRDGKLSIEDIKRRYKDCDSEIANLTDRFFSLNDGLISISFLDEQFEFTNKISLTNSQNGKKGGRPKANKDDENKPTANRPLTDREANESKENKESKGEEIKEDILNKEKESLNNYSDKEDSRNGIVIYDKESLISELENTKWIKDLALRFKLDDLTTKSKLNEFADDLKLKSGYKRNLAEIKTHFFNVLNKKVEVDKKTTIVQPTRKFAGS